MASLNTNNPPAHAESKSSKKKKAKAEKAENPATPNPEGSQLGEARVGGVTNGDAGIESPYIKELHK